MIYLRHDKCSHQNHDHDPEHNLFRGVPGVENPSKVDRHRETNVPSGEDDYAEEVILLQLLFEWSLGLEILGRKEEENKRGEEGADREVDVETPSPGCAAHSKCTSDLGSNQLMPSKPVGVYLQLVLEPFPRPRWALQEKCTSVFLSSLS